MIEMKLTPDPTNPSVSILELKIKAPAAPEPTPIPEVKIPTLIFIDDTIEADQLPLITHALTDTVNRISWPDQIQIFTSNNQMPNHLEVTELQKSEIFKEVESKGQCNLLVLTNNETKDLKRQIAKASEFLTNAHAIQPTTTIELIDTLNDHVKHLKQKTLVNLKVEIELTSENDTLQPLNYLPGLTKKGNKYFANLIDLAGEDEKAYAFEIRSTDCKTLYTLEDLVLGRRISGGQRILTSSI